MGFGIRPGISVNSEDTKGSMFKMSIAMPVPGVASKKKRIRNRNPVPDNFKVLKEDSFGKFSVVMVHYPNCTNYEGKKVMVLKWKSKGKKASNLTWLDPHFTDKASVDPKVIARFAPTNDGYMQGLLLASRKEELRVHRIRLRKGKRD